MYKINSKSLRVGNIVNHKGNPIIVESICDIGINFEIDDFGHCPQTYWILYNELSPVKLTDEWFTKFNFSVNKNDKRVREDDNVFNGYSTGYYFDTQQGLFYFRESNIYSEKIKYVHQFQNFYNDLTQKELPTINL